MDSGLLVSLCSKKLEARWQPSPSWPSGTDPSLEAPAMLPETTRAMPVPCTSSASILPRFAAAARYLLRGIFDPVVPEVHESAPQVRLRNEDDEVLHRAIDPDPRTY